MRRARESVAGGVGGVSSIWKSGWNAVKCSGTSGPSSRRIHSESAVTSASESLCPGMSRVVISNQTCVSRFKYTSVSSTGWRWPRHTFR